ncbi:metal-sulfur cluster assembly factor [Eremococcus coleocola]|uniref:metal-sulfur cluster assembly factor n=1 Tax=Eremococcus coleocola TaxID=88132 RepID=UPI0004096FA3|nr:metal-sulfur cluster assembly factor [Eremococcus coleocola]
MEEKEYGVVWKDRAVSLREDFVNQLYRVIDPELGIDIVNLGLVYEIGLDDKGLCTMLMTLTTPGCPLVDYLENDIRYVLSEIDEIEAVDFQLTFHPMWTMDRISRFGKIALGVAD